MWPTVGQPDMPFFAHFFKHLRLWTSQKRLFVILGARQSNKMRKDGYPASDALKKKQFYSGLGLILLFRSKVLRCHRF
jgi:hypothetical protein